MNPILSSSPGRIRLRHPALRNPDRLQTLATTIGTWPQVGSVEANARTGSLLILYDATTLDEDLCGQRCTEALSALIPPPSGQLAPPSPTPRHPPSTRVRLNRLAKRGMLLSLATSLVLAADGAKRA
ncbi:MAG: HMA2 domain-containing protein, partial [Halothiobacillaceae bacterium]